MLKSSCLWSTCCGVLKPQCLLILWANVDALTTARQREGGTMKVAHKNSALADELKLVKEKARQLSEDGCAYFVVVTPFITDDGDVFVSFGISNWYDGSVIASFDSGRQV